MLDIIDNYLNSIKDMSEKDKEHTHRSALQILLTEIKDFTANKNIKIIHEPNNDKEGRGAPITSLSIFLDSELVNIYAAIGIL